MKNYHTHTTRCMHAIGSEEEYILAAISAGYTELGFSDHTPWHYESGYHATMRMDESQLEDYVHTLSVLRDKYKDKILLRLVWSVNTLKIRWSGLRNSLKSISLIILF